MGDHQVRITPTIAEARKILESGEFDALLVDYDLDDGKGDALVREVRKAGDQGRIIAASSHHQGNMALMAAGADAVCPKDQIRNIEQILTAM